MELWDLKRFRTCSRLFFGITKEVERGASSGSELFIQLTSCLLFQVDRGEGEERVGNLGYISLD